MKRGERLLSPAPVLLLAEVGEDLVRMIGRLYRLVHLGDLAISIDDVADARCVGRGVW
jgi:hypothetical protein